MIHDDYIEMKRLEAIYGYNTIDLLNEKKTQLDKYEWTSKFYYKQLQDRAQLLDEANVPSVNYILDEEYSDNLSMAQSIEEAIPLCKDIIKSIERYLYLVSLKEREKEVAEIKKSIDVPEEVVIFTKPGSVNQGSLFNF